MSADQPKTKLQIMKTVSGDYLYVPTGETYDTFMLTMYTIYWRTFSILVNR